MACTGAPYLLAPGELAAALLCASATWIWLQLSAVCTAAESNRELKSNGYTCTPTCIYIYYYYYFSFFTAVPRKRGIATVMDRIIALAIMNNKKKANIAWGTKRLTKVVRKCGFVCIFHPFKHIFPCVKWMECFSRKYLKRKGSLYLQPKCLPLWSRV